MNLRLGEPGAVLPRLRVATLVGAAWLAVLLLGGARASFGGDDDVAAAQARLDAGDARGALEAFRRLSEAPGGAEDPKVQAGLGAALLATDDPHGAIAALWVAVRRRGDVADRARLAEALVAAARANLESGPRISAEVVPYLQDALDQVAAARAGSAAAKDPTSAVSARLAALEGEARWWLGDAGGARAALSHPGLAHDARAQDFLARACYAGGLFAQAADAWKAAGSLRGAAAAWAAGKDERALPAYIDLVRASPDDVALLDEAIAAALWLRQAPRLDEELAALPAPDAAARARIARARGRLAERSGRPADAVPRYREARAADPGDAEVEADLGRALLSAGAEDAAAVTEAVDLFVEVLRKRPQDEWARRGLEFIARRDGESAPKEWPDKTRLLRCVRIFQTLAETEPDDATAWAQVGNALRVAGESAQSIAAFDRAVSVNPYDASLQNDRGIALLASGDRAGALAAFEKAADLDPTDLSPRQNAARLRWLAGDDEAAQAHLSAALASSRVVGGHPMLFRFLLDRVTRSQVRPDAR